MKLKLPSRALALLLLAAAPAAFAQTITPTPALLNYQGRVQTGTPPADFTGTGQFKFALIDPSPDLQRPARLGTPTLAGQTIASIPVMEVGFGYLSLPVVTIGAPQIAGGVQATATAVISSGTVDRIQINNAGSGYTSPPTVSITAPPVSPPAIVWNNNGNQGEPVTPASLPVTNGLYSVLLGDTSLANMAAIPSAIFARPNLRLRVWFNNTQLSPDQRLATTPYLPGGVTVGGSGNGFVHQSRHSTLKHNISVGTYVDDEGGWVGTFTNDPLLFFTSDGPDPSLTLETNGDLNMEGNLLKNVGRIGVGTTNPTNGTVHIAGTAGSNIGAHRFYGGNADQIGSGNSGPQVNTSLYASGEIHASIFRAFSDARIKNITGPSDGAKDLAALLGIQITDYTYRDTATRGTTPQKKVIAQQVEKVFPQAVSRSTDVVPDIYKKAAAKDGWISLATDLKTGERVRLATDKAEEVYEVLEVRDGAFRTACTESGDLFVYGREVKDFRTVDYEAIAMLNVSATQQVKKESDAALAALRDENTALRTRLEALETAAAKRDAQLAALTRLLERSTGDTVTVSTTALTK